MLFFLWWLLWVCLRASWAPSEEMMGFTRLRCLTPVGDCLTPACSVPARLMSNLLLFECLRAAADNCQYSFSVNVWGYQNLYKDSGFCYYPNLNADGVFSSYNLVVLDLRPIFWHQLLYYANSIQWHPRATITLHFESPAVQDCPMYIPVDPRLSDASSALTAICASIFTTKNQAWKQTVTSAMVTENSTSFLLQDYAADPIPVLQLRFLGRGFECGGELRGVSVTFGRATVTYRGTMQRPAENPNDTRTPKSTYWALAAPPTLEPATLLLLSFYLLS